MSTSKEKQKKSQENNLHGHHFGVSHTPDQAKNVKKVASSRWSLHKSKSVKECKNNGNSDHCFQEGRKSMCSVGSEKSYERKSMEIMGRKSTGHMEVASLSYEVELNQVKVLVTDMPGFMQAKAFRCARRTYDSMEKFSAKLMGYNLKKEFDKTYGPAWHCVVGSSFGSFVSHTTACFLYFSMEKLYILLFKTKVEKPWVK